MTSLSCSLRQDKLAVAIGTFHLRPGPHFEEDAGMAERAAAAITGDAMLVDYDDFWRRCRHGENVAQSFEFGRIIPGQTAAASASGYPHCISTQLSLVSAPGLAPIAQLDRVLPSEGRGRTFESCWVRHSLSFTVSKHGRQLRARHHWRVIEAICSRAPKLTRGTMFHEFSARIRDLFSGR